MLAGIKIKTALLAAAAPAIAADTKGLFSAFGVIAPSRQVEAPAFTLTDVHGKERTLAEFDGKLVLLNFWATWCGPCRDEMPALERLWKEFEDEGLVVVAIAADRGSMEKVGNKVEKFCEMHEMTFPVLLDPEGDVRKVYEITALPTSYLVGRDGRLLGKIIGERAWDSAEAKRLIRGLLK